MATSKTLSSIAQSRLAAFQQRNSSGPIRNCSIRTFAGLEGRALKALELAHRPCGGAAGAKRRQTRAIARGYPPLGRSSRRMNATHVKG